MSQARPAPGPETDRVLTVPNALSALRLVGVPVFLWLIVVGSDGWALVVLAVSGFTDYLDGKIARRFHQTSRLGELLDPIADRLYVVCTVAGLAWRQIIPLWLVGLLVLRELVMVALLLRLRSRGQVGLPVNYVGKAATFNLLYAFPILLVAQFPGAVGQWALPIGWAFAWWGVGLYWLSAVLYAVQTLQFLAAHRAASTRAA
ncbi:MAG: CDP-alcohol phosphatidyltransferase family protein [Dermatophilaceae bacterium]